MLILTENVKISICQNGPKCSAKLMCGWIQKPAIQRTAFFPTQFKQDLEGLPGRDH